MRKEIMTRGLPGQGGDAQYTFIFTGTKGYQLTIPCKPKGRSGDYYGDAAQESWLMGLSDYMVSDRLIDVVASCQWKCRSERARDTLMAMLHVCEA
jgi:hypothetical protein